MKKLTQRIFKKYPEASNACINNDGTVSLYTSEFVHHGHGDKAFLDKDWYVYPDAGGKRWLHTELVEDFYTGQCIWNKNKCPELYKLHHKAEREAWKEHLKFKKEHPDWFA